MDLRYPIGHYEPQPYSEKQRQDWLNDIKFLPQSLENSLLNLNEKQQLTPYREGGWTVKQLVHHVADSHMNAYCRFKLGLTEDNPTIRPYEEQLWAELSDTHYLPANVSITLLYALHTRWFELLRHIDGDTWKRTIVHPASKKQMDLWYLMGLYAWHGKHHVAHVTLLRERHGW
ncbi:MAG TPA: putative metal-dependent hydrolase [Chitinophagaceae bacterium]|jgi:DinB superfamily|nr:putative metal-dependent hydrolase [Chitinophagaceae bacterium]